MDGILGRLMRLEDAKHNALIEANAAAYDSCVREQTLLITESLLHSPVQPSRKKLLEFSRLANRNTNLYLNRIPHGKEGGSRHER
jgi:hypothetical protein